MKTKLTALVLALAMAFGLTACTTAEEGSAAGSAGNAGQSSSTSQTSSQPEILQPETSGPDAEGSAGSRVFVDDAGREVDIPAELYPEYCDYDVKADIQEYYELFYGCQLTDEQYQTLTANAFLGG